MNQVTLQTTECMRTNSRKLRQSVQQWQSGQLLKLGCESSCTTPPKPSLCSSNVFNNTWQIKHAKGAEKTPYKVKSPSSIELNASYKVIQSSIHQSEMKETLVAKKKTGWKWEFSKQTQSVAALRLIYLCFSTHLKSVFKYGSTKHSTSEANPLKLKKKSKTKKIEILMQHLQRISHFQATLMDIQGSYPSTKSGWCNHESVTVPSVQQRTSNNLTKTCYRNFANFNPATSFSKHH